MSRTSLNESLEEFNRLHQGAKAGTLGPGDLAKYQAARAKLAHLLLAGQHVALQPGQRPRRALRVTCALQAELEFCDGSVRATTLQLSSGGFAALLVSAPRVGELVKVSLRMPSGQPFQADARVMAVKEYLGNAGTSFQFLNLSESQYERLEMLVFDALLAQFKTE